MNRKKPAAGLLLLLALVALLPGCATMNVVSDGADERLMLRGNDPVAYQTLDKAVRGDPQIKAQHDGVTYRFISEEHRRLFTAAPQKYVPAYGGFCASGAHYALKANIGANTYKVVNGRLFLFGSPRSRRNWELDQQKNIELGDWYWEHETKDRPFRPQNWYRYMFRVAHYKTDAEWQRRNGKP